jgi:hypothetical protein
MLCWFFFVNYGECNWLKSFKEVYLKEITYYLELITNKQFNTRGSYLIKSYEEIHSAQFLEDYFSKLFKSFSVSTGINS